MREPCLINRYVKKIPQRGSKRTFHHFIGNTFATVKRPDYYVTCKQELLVFRAVTAFRCESDDSECDLTPMQEVVIVEARCGSLL